jgi:hypothetical protein
MAATASIIIEVDDQGATQAFQRINAESTNLSRNLQPIAGQSDEAFGAIAVGARQSREQVALLSEEMGIGIPRAMRGVISGMPGISSAINSAFMGLAVVGFIGIAESAGEAVTKLVERFTGWAESTKKINDSIHELQTTLQADVEKTKGLNDAYQLLGLSGIPLVVEKQKLANDEFKAAKGHLTDLIAQMAILRQKSLETESAPTRPGGIRGSQLGESIPVPTEAAKVALEEIPKLQNQIDELGKTLLPSGSLQAGLQNLDKEFSDAFSKEHADGVREIGVAAQEALTKLQAMTKTATSGGNTPEQAIEANKRALEEQIADLLSFSGDEEDVRRAAAAAIQAIEKKASDDRVKLLTEEADKKLKSITDGYEAEDRLAQEQAKKLRTIESTTEQEETQAAIALAPPWERANAKIVDDYQQRMSKIKEMLDDGELDEEQAARRAAAAWTTAFAQMRDELANKMETLFDDITSGNIGQAFLKMFKQLVFQMLATWILGMQGMHAAASQTMTGSGGGPLSGILGALGIGGSSGGGSQENISGLPGVITNLTGESSSNSPMGVLAGTGLSAGGGISLGSSLPAGAGGGAGGSGISGLLNSGALNGLLLTGGAGLLVNGVQRGGILGVLESAAGGAMGGFAIGSMIGAGLGPIGMGIGALIGGLVGIISSIFGEHSGDKARKQVIEPMEAQLKVIEDSYDVFQTDYNTGVASLETLRTDTIASLKKIGGRQVSGNTAKTNADIDAAELHLKTTEAERNRRSQIDFGPPQFLTGGFVHPSMAGGAPGWFAGTAMHFAGGGAVPAILHAGEFVMSPSATQRVGPGNLSRLNAGGSMGGMTLNVTTMDSKSFSGWLRDGGLRVIARELKRAGNEGGF